MRDPTEEQKGMGGGKYWGSKTKGVQPPQMHRWDASLGPLANVLAAIEPALGRKGRAFQNYLPTSTANMGTIHSKAHHQNRLDDYGAQTSQCLHIYAGESQGFVSPSQRWMAKKKRLGRIKSSMVNMSGFQLYSGRKGGSIVLSVHASPRPALPCNNLLCRKRSTSAAAILVRLMQ